MSDSGASTTEPKSQEVAVVNHAETVDGTGDIILDAEAAEKSAVVGLKLAADGHVRASLPY
jgi:hypothetical protein